MLAYTIETSAYLPQFTEEVLTVVLSLRERFIEPLLHPVTVPFEPWITTKKETVLRPAFYYMGCRIITHPANYNFLKRQLELNQ
jgi:hypothetical protein